MVILIGGVSCTGKTAMAQKLLEIYKFPYMSIDHLKMGLYRGTADCKFTPEDSTEFIGEHLWPIIKAIIMTNIENNQNLIIEGCYLLPNLITDFDDEYINHILALYIGFSEKYIKNNYISGIIKHCGQIEARGSDAVSPMEQLVMEHAEQKALCLAYNANYFEIDEDYLITMERIFDWIDIEINKRNELHV